MNRAALHPATSTRLLVLAMVSSLAACEGSRSVVGVSPDSGTANDLGNDVTDVTDASDVADVNDAADVSDVTDANDVTDAGDAADAGDASDAVDVPDVPVVVSTTRAVVECGAVCQRPLDAIPNATATEVYFTAFSAMGRAAVFRATVPAAGAPAVTPSLVAEGNGMEFPVGIALSTDGMTLYVADPSADGPSAPETGAIFAIPVAGGTPTRINVGTDVLRPQGVAASSDGTNLFITAQQATSTDILHALFRVTRTGGAAVAITTDLVDPSGVSQDSMGYITIFDARRNGPNGGTAFILASPRNTDLARDVVANHPAGASLAVNGRSALISGTVADTGGGLLTWVGTDGRATSPTSLSTGMVTPLGLHRARMADTWAVADEGAGDSGQIFLVTVRP
jgi:hypothetical protein